MLNKVIMIFLTSIIFYFGGTAIGLKYYLSEIVFKQTPDIHSTESTRYLVTINNNESLVRLYGDPANTACVVFFPGQHGGILRYEVEIFRNLTDNGIAVYALSYPGYEGAKGIPTFSSIQKSTLSAMKYINDNTSCKSNKTIYVGRSLGASVALGTAEKITPKGMLLDSVGRSLASTIRIRLSNNIWTKPLNVLPVEKLLDFETSLDDALLQLKEVPITIFQGTNDSLTPLNNIASILSVYSNVRLIPVEGADHRNTHILAGAKYITEISQLMSK